jgi:hypothetical protein
MPGEKWFDYTHECPKVSRMTKIPPFSPSDLKTIRQLFKEGVFPPETKLRTILKLCYARKFPCVRIANEWCTTEAAVRAWAWNRATPAFREITS